MRMESLEKDTAHHQDNAHVTSFSVRAKSVSGTTQVNSVQPVSTNSKYDRLPTSTELVRRHVFIPDVRCKICLGEDESAAHLFVGCMFAQRVWDYVIRWCKIKPIYILEIKDMLQVPEVNHGSPKWKKFVLSVVQGSIWVLWKTRNEAVFKQKQANFSMIVEEIKALRYLWIKKLSEVFGY